SVSLSARSRETNRLAKTWGISVPVCGKLTINGASPRFTSIAGSSTQLGIVPPDAPVQRIGAEPIHKLGWHLDVPDCQVTIFSRLKRADLSRSAKGPGRSPGDAGDALFDRDPKESRAHIHGQKQRGQRRRTRVKIGRKRYRDAVLAQERDRRNLRLA